MSVLGVDLIRIFSHSDWIRTSRSSSPSGETYRNRFLPAFPSVFLLVETNHISAGGHQYFWFFQRFFNVEVAFQTEVNYCQWKQFILASGHQYFWFSQRFFNVEVAFPYSGNVFFNILMETIFFGQNYFAASRNRELGENSFQRKSSFLLGYYFFSILLSDSKESFQQNPSFQIVEMDFLTTGNHFLLFRGFSSNWKRSLKLVEAIF